MEQHFKKVVHNVSHRWDDLARELGFTENEIKGIRTDQPDQDHGCREVLDRWGNREGREATLQVLKQALIDINERLTAESLEVDMEKLIDKVVRYVSRKWDDLARYLHFSLQEIEAIESMKPSPEHRCIEMMHRWRSREGRGATVQVLKQALIDIDERLTAESLEDFQLTLERIFSRLGKTDVRKLLRVWSARTGQQERAGIERPQDLMRAMEKSGHIATDDLGMLERDMMAAGISFPVIVRDIQGVSDKFQHPRISEATVGPVGGEVEIPGFVKLVVPQGVLQRETTITVSTVDIPGILRGEEGVSWTSGYPWSLGKNACPRELLDQVLFSPAVEVNLHGARLSGPVELETWRPPGSEGMECVILKHHDGEGWKDITATTLHHIGYTKQYEDAVEFHVVCRDQSVTAYEEMYPHDFTECGTNDAECDLYDRDRIEVAVTLDGADVTEYFDNVVTKVSHKWDDLARQLGSRTRNEIKEIRASEPDDEHRCRKVLESWRNKMGKEASVQILKQALVAIDECQEMEMAMETFEEARLNQIGRAVGEEWERLGQELGLGKDVLDNIRRDVETQAALQMLKAWRTKTPHGPLHYLPQLEETLQNIGKPDLAKDVQESYKEYWNGLQITELSPHTYEDKNWSLRLPGEGKYLCRRTDLGVVTPYPLHVTYRSANWSDYTWPQEQGWMAVGPLFSIQCEDVEGPVDILLPHVLHLAEDTEITREDLKVVHVVGDSPELLPVTELTPSHAVTRFKKGSKFGVVGKKDKVWSVSRDCLLMAFRYSDDSDISTLKVYIVSNTKEMKQNLQENEEEWNFELCDFKTCQLAPGDAFYMKGTVTNGTSKEVKISPKRLIFEDTLNNNKFYEPFRVEVTVDIWMDNTSRLHLELLKETTDEANEAQPLSELTLGRYKRSRAAGASAQGGNIGKKSLSRKKIGKVAKCPQDDGAGPSGLSRQDVIKEVSHKWEDLARKLGFSENKIKGMRRSETDDDKRCREVLNWWRNKNGRKATLQILKQALIDIDEGWTAENLEDDVGGGESSISSDD
ncbi:hypothetical protein Bbelb_270820 [Branchiostoma belcheri]|nr:hypothetical protein Bbelb_270820 [Branchiostoma belcheri]